jgi:RHS repeat-associated protein
VAVTGANGLITQVHRDANGLPIAIVGPYGQVTQLIIDANGFLASAIDPANETILLASSAGGLVLSITSALDSTETIQYDSIGRAIQTQDAGGNKSLFAHSDSGGPVTATLTTATGDIQTRTLDLLPNGDTLIQRTYPDNSMDVQLSARSGGGAITNSDGSIVTYTMTADPRFPLGTQVPATVTTAFPDGLTSSFSVSRTVQLANPDDPTSLVAGTNVLTLNGQSYTNVYTASNRTEVVTSPEGRQRTLVLDDHGRVIRSQKSFLSPTDTIYDSAGRISALVGQSSTARRQTDFSYDGSGRLSATVDPVGRTNSYGYDTVNRPTTTTFPDGRLLILSYNAESRVTNILTPSGASHTLTYNSVGLLTGYTPPAVNGAVASLHYHYDVDQRLNALSLPSGQSINLNLGPGGRIDELAITSGKTLSFRYHPVSGLVSNITASTGDALTYWYQGPLVTNVAWSGSSTGALGTKFDQFFRVREQTVNGGQSVDYAYDRDGFLTQAGELRLTTDPSTGLLSSTAIGEVTNQWQYNEFTEPTNYVATVHGQVMFSTQYESDKLGRITRKTEAIQGVTDTFDYTYDLAGRLIGVRKNGAAFSAYTYDLNGNRLSKTDTNGTVPGSYDAQDRLIQYGAATYNYSANGDLSGRSGPNPLTTQYDELGNLVQAKTAGGDIIECVVDPAQRRIGKRKNGQLIQAFLYQNDLRPIVELDSTNSIVSQFVYATGVNVPDYVLRGGKTYSLIRDHLGSVRLVVDTQTGTVVQRLDYGDFGEVTLDSNPGFQPFGFAGGIYDSETGLVRFGQRDYDPETGKWTTKDPSGFGGQTVNLYEYCFNDPVNFADSTGSSPTGRLPTGNLPPPESGQFDYEVFSFGAGIYGSFIRDRFGRWYGVVGLSAGFSKGVGPCGARGYLTKPQGRLESDAHFKQRLYDFITGLSNSYGIADVKGVTQNLPDNAALGESWEYGTQLAVGVGAGRSYAEAVDLGPNGDPGIQAMIRGVLLRDKGDTKDHYWDAFWSIFHR